MLKRLSIVLICLLSGCHRFAPEQISTADLGDLRSLEAKNIKGMTVTGIRYTALRDSALSVGARAGLASRAKELNVMLMEHHRIMERAFNFQRLMLEDNVLPPVLVEARNTVDMAGTDIIRISDRTYGIYQQARFISVAPTWRDYLWLSYNAPETPDRTLLPKNKAERMVWDEYVQQGWKAGIDQANNIFTESLGRLKRDFIGMIRYRSLLAQNMVSAPFVAKVDLGVTGSGNEISVNERVLRITEMPTLRLNAKDWEAELTPSPKERDNDMRF